MKIPLEAERLYALGFAIHWLHPHSKKPINAGWTQPGRLSLEGLRETYRKGYNVGVKLGESSHIRGRYLAIIDVDVKSDNLTHRAEALEAMLKAFPECKDGPYLKSGRGNGSCHYYALTDTPVSGNEVKAQSEERVKVHMPSVKPSRDEENNLTFDELAGGIRLRNAWEVSILSKGRQSVLAGSIHPDTGAAYAWGRIIEADASNIPVLDFKRSPLGPALSLVKPHQDTSAPLEAFEDVDVEDLPLTKGQKDAITDGVGVENRSNSVHSLTLTLMNLGVPDKTIISVFTNRDNYLGEVAYDHGRTNSREKAARWLLKYGIKKARDRIEATDFDVEELPEDIERKNAKKKKAKLKANADTLHSLIWPMGFTENPSSWEKELELKPMGRLKPPLVKPTYGNLRLILANSCVRPDFLNFDKFAERAFYTCNTPWNARANAQRSTGTEDALIVKSWLEKKYGLVAGIGVIDEILDTVTLQNSFHPVRDYLEGLVWDSTPRIAEAFKTYMGAVMPEPYLSEVSKIFFVAGVTRIFEPGTKFDHMVVLEGRQGIGKSTFASILASKPWFLDGLPDFHDKDAALNLIGTWICELSELASLNKSDTRAAKAFISRDTDRLRPPYGKRRVDYPRSSLLLGTTNDSEYLSDTSGDRRYWPVLCTRCDFKALVRDRDQLWAEAAYYYWFAPTKLYLENKQAAKQAKQIQGSRRGEDEGDLVREDLRAWLMEQDVEVKAITTKQAISEALNHYAFNRALIFRTSAALLHLGFKKHHTRRGNIWKK